MINACLRVALLARSRDSASSTLTDPKFAPYDVNNILPVGRPPKTFSEPGGMMDDAIITSCFLCDEF